ncbi:hypothetical protein [Streptomyces sp. DASNCL29]|uniref:hypothetical protein n=1 Tax=Streptomyces sp. DASNCL29 TaxID=2583819 RepID=UPI00110FDB34|nr:hypothetical protein [Streptomyces sp. DASNCL29]TMU98074.1 hypothetical protein FGK60_09580 [Streptomyces sp. DASNCL29]
MTSYRLDVPELHRRLDAHRYTRSLSWRAVSRETGLPQSTFSRIARGRSVEADALVTLLVWLGTATDVAGLIEPAQESATCPVCGGLYRPRRDGQIRRHNCRTAEGSDS